jgi:hypothetical protein
MLHFAPHALHFMLVSHTCTFAIDPTEMELEERTEQAQVKDFTNLDLSQGKHRCINPWSLSFTFECYFMFLYDYALRL